MTRTYSDTRTRVETLLRAYRGATLLAVQRGALLLDQERPAWRNDVRIDRLDVSREDRTVIGQLFGTHRRAVKRLRLTEPEFYGFDRPHQVAIVQELQDTWLAELLWPYVEWARLRVHIGAAKLSEFFNGRDVRFAVHPLRIGSMGSDMLSELFGNVAIGQRELSKITDLSLTEMGLYSEDPNEMAGIRQAWLMYLRGEL